MEILIQNVPYYCLLWIGVGFILLIIGIFILSYKQSNVSQYTEKVSSENVLDDQSNVQELLSFFLQEEEKKNNDFRKNLMKAYAQKDDQEINTNSELSTHSSMPIQKEKFSDIIKLCEQGLDANEIAKRLKMGKGEVELIISLYMMR